MMHVYCPHCQSRLNVEDRLAGTTGQCPGCNEAFVIPTSSAHVEAPASEPVAVVAGGGGGAAPAHAPQAVPTHPEKVARPRISAPFEPQVSGESVIGAAVGALMKALNVKTLGFYLAGTIAILIVVYTLLRVGVATGNREVMAGLSLISLVIGVGLCGVLAGGVAFMAHSETRREQVQVKRALQFCGAKFIALFGGFWIAILGVVLALALVNGTISFLTKLPFGPLVTAMLFIPHFLVNFLLLVVLPCVVLVPCSIAVENGGAVSALKWLVGCMIRQPRALVVHVAMTLLFTYVVAVVYVAPVLLVLVLTGYSNSADEPMDWSELLPTSWISGEMGSSGPDQTVRDDWGFQAPPPAFSNPRTSGARAPDRRTVPAPVQEQPGVGSHLASGNWLRVISAGVIVVAGLGYMAAYWIVSMTGFYERARLAVGK
jgi:hypothetical protein